MSSLWFNLRLGGLFIQFTKFGTRVTKPDGSPGSLVSISRVRGRPNAGEPWAELYELRWPW